MRLLYYSMYSQKLCIIVLLKTSHEKIKYNIIEMLTIFKRFFNLFHQFKGNIKKIQGLKNAMNIYHLMKI